MWSVVLPTKYALRVDTYGQYSPRKRRREDVCPVCRLDKIVNHEVHARYCRGEPPRRLRRRSRQEDERLLRRVRLAEVLPLSITGIVRSEQS